MKASKIFFELSKTDQEWAKTIQYPEKTKTLFSSRIIVFDTNGKNYSYSYLHAVF